MEMQYNRIKKTDRTLQWNSRRIIFVREIIIFPKDILDPKLVDWIIAKVIKIDCKTAPWRQSISMYFVQQLCRWNISGNFQFFHCTAHWFSELMTERQIISFPCSKIRKVICQFLLVGFVSYEVGMSTKILGQAQYISIPNSGTGSRGFSMTFNTRETWDCGVDPSQQINYLAGTETPFSGIFSPLTLQLLALW